MTGAKVAVTGIGAMTAFAKGAKGWRDFRPDRLWATPSPQAGAWFDATLELGGRGFKYYNAATCYLLAAVKQFETDAAAQSADVSERRGVVIGSNTCTRQDLDQIDQTVLDQGSAGIHPMRAPSFCANVGTGTVSIRTQAKAFNITLMNPMTAGLEAVVLAKNAIAAGRAGDVIAGAMEDDASFTLGERDHRVDVCTAGGAWALRLSAGDTDAALPVVGHLGRSLSRFVPARVLADPAGFAQLQRDLEHDLMPLLDRGPALRVCIAMLTDAHSRAIGKALQSILQAHGVPRVRIDVPAQDTRHGTLLALAQLSWLCTQPGPGLCIAISPLGHVTMLDVEGRSH
jgi:3-oxoacyl-[acyl-carrier-protein] synthase II